MIGIEIFEALNPPLSSHDKWKLGPLRLDPIQCMLRQGEDQEGVLAPRINQHYCNLCHDLADGYHIPRLGICKRNIWYNYSSAANIPQQYRQLGFYQKSNE